MKKLRIKNLAELREFAKKVAGQLKGGEVIALTGPLAAGKTTFVQMLGKALGVAERITSPTFTIMHVHATGKKKTIKSFIHVDAYRLKNASELAAIGIEDYLGKKDTVVVVEWADRVQDILTTPTISIDMDVIDRDERIISVQK